MDNYERYQQAREARKQKAKRRQVRILLVLLLLFLVLAASIIGVFFFPDTAPEPTVQTALTVSTQVQTDTPLTTTQEQTQEQTEPEPETDWRLLLVNQASPVPDGFTVELKELRNSQLVDARIYPELQQMFDDARSQGLAPKINESYRSGAQQQQILENRIAKYVADGYSQADAETAARAEVASPGTSEHELGLAVDITTDGEIDPTELWSWLAQNSWRYGFILRYPEGKTDLTGITYEPWHFRYVGSAAAEEIFNRGICLEEYLAQP